MVDEVAARERLRVLLTPALPTGPNVCRLCFTWAPDGYDTCRNCRIASRSLPRLPQQVVVPMAIAVKHQSLASWLWRYKNSPDSTDSGSSSRTLAYIAANWFLQHEVCLATQTGCAAFDVITWVPSSSTSREGEHPLARLLTSIQSVRDRLEPLLAGMPGTAHELDLNRFRATRSLRGERVLIVDDTYTTGYSIRVAVHALRAAGAASVGAVVVGRHFDRDWGDCESYYDEARAAGYQWDVCALEN